MIRRFVAAALLALFAAVSVSAAGVDEKDGSKPVIGVVNWDCSLPSNTYFGYYATSSLSPDKYRYCTPYYADVLGPDSIEYHWRGVREYEIEMQFAIDAGIDYFAYCWYGETPGKRLPPLVSGQAKCCDGTVYELANARQLHLQSSLKEKLKLCAILVVVHPYSDEELDKLAQTMKQTCYQKACGRPLVYLFGGRGDNARIVPRLRAACAKAGSGEPYIVALADSKLETEGEFAVQAISAYNDGCFSGAGSNEEQRRHGIEKNALRVATGMDIVPVFTSGWDPSPRIDHPVPWTSYKDVPYMKPESSEEFAAAGKEFVDWALANKSAWPSGHFMTFAWNEFEEGGWICPTWTPDGPDISRVKAFRTVVEYLKENYK